MKPIRSLPTLPKRDPDGHKGLYGRVLIVGGSVGMIGAPALAANAALRSGAGLVKIACPKPAQQAIATLAPCATSAPIPATPAGQLAASAADQIIALLGAHDVLAIGPGLGRGNSIRRITKRLLAACNARPAVVDADALNALAALANWWKSTTGPVILTPHPGEMRRLLAGAKLSVDPDDRQPAAAALARRTGHIVVLKGRHTVVTDAQRVYVNRTGNPGMATGGTGDVLTGIIAGLLGQSLDPFDAAVLATYLHGKAGDLAAKQKTQLSLIASDLLDTLPNVFKTLTPAPSRRPMRAATHAHHKTPTRKK